MLEVVIPTTKVIISEENLDFKTLEQTFLECGKRLAREALQATLSQLDQRLEKNRNKKRFELKDIRSRKLLTVLGEVKLERRYYLDKEKKTHGALLDDYLGIKKEERVSGRLKDLSCELATEMSFGKVSQTLERLLNEPLSRQSVWKAVQVLGAQVQETQSQEQEKVFARAESVTTPEKPSACLFGEADGCMIALQREKSRLAELKVGAWYEGWQKKPVKRREYALVNKRYVGTTKSAEDFWELMALEAEKHYGLSKVSHVYVGGDGASWIETGGKWIGASRIKLDQFHLHRLLGRAFGFSETIGKVVRQLLDGKPDEAMKSLAAEAVQEDDEKKRVKKAEAIAWIADHHEHLKTVSYPSELKTGLLKRQLGTMERHVDLTVAERFKKRGMSWSLRGAGNLLVLRIKKLNREWPPTIPAQTVPKESVKVPLERNKRKGPYPIHQGGIPAVQSGKPWTKSLKERVLGRSFATRGRVFEQSAPTGA
jgi:hypothetical protein